MTRTFWILFFCLFTEQLNGQNLVPNASFEEVNEITVRWAGTHTHFNRWMKAWDSPTQGSPDLLYIGSLPRMFPKRPKVDLSGYAPRTGDFMVGIKTYGCENNTLHCKEYIQIKLHKPLKKGKKYYFEYWIQAISPSVKVNSFGIAFSKVRLQKLMQTGVIDLNPVMMTENISYTTDSKWSRVKGVFIARDSFDYVIIGNFGSDDVLRYELTPNGIDYGYYLLDDVVIIPQEERVQAKMELNEPFVLEEVLFEFDKAEIQESSRFQLDEIVEILQADTTTRLEINGHTDSEGTEEYNQALSQNRADVIKAFLVENGIEGQRMKTIGYGSKRPRIKDASNELRKFNRRVEIRLIPILEE